MKTMKIIHPNFDEELRFLHLGYDFVAGADEVGRGAFAGPIVAAAVILPFHFSAKNDLKDSKVLSPLKRQQLSKIIKKEAVLYAISEVPVWHINKFGIGKSNDLALFKAIRELFERLNDKKIFFLIDGFNVKRLKRSVQKAIIRGDSTSCSISAASIIAKVHRDEIMEKLAAHYTNFGFAENKGYGTKFHRDAIYKHGLTDTHRTSFNLEIFCNLEGFRKN